MFLPLKDTARWRHTDYFSILFKTLRPFSNSYMGKKNNLDVLAYSWKSCQLQSLSHIYYFPDLDILNSTTMVQKLWSRALMIHSSEFDTAYKSPAEIHGSRRSKNCYLLIWRPLLSSRLIYTFQPDSSHYHRIPTIPITTPIEPITKTTISEWQTFRNFKNKEK